MRGEAENGLKEKDHIHSEALDHRPDGRSVVGGLLPGTVYGPVHSRRYGRALGLNLVPVGRKVCSFDCVYCECGFTDHRALQYPKEDFPLAKALVAETERVLERFEKSGGKLESIVLSGNGEPTLHPDFIAISRGLAEARDEHAPHSRLVLLSNGTMLKDSDVREALSLYDERVMKLDAGREETFQKMCRPLARITLDEVVDLLRSVRPYTLQTMFIHAPVDNAAPEEIEAWIKRVREAEPESVQIYSLDRAPADARCEPVPRDELEEIAERLRAETGLEVSVF